MFKFFSYFFQNKSNFDDKCYAWNSGSSKFEKIANFKIIPSSLLKGIENQKDIIKKNTNKFANGYIRQIWCC